MQDKPPSPNYNQLHGWTLVALYGSLAILAFLLLYAFYFSQSLFVEKPFQFYITAAVTVIAALYNAAAATRFFQITISKKTLPALALKPFLFMALTLLFAGRLFSDI